jgi:hypothetical protein
MSDDKSSRDKLDQFYEKMAHAAADDTSFAETLMRSQDVDPDEAGGEMMTQVRRVIAQAKLEQEEVRRSSLPERVSGRVQELIDQFGSAIEALQSGIQTEELSLQFRKLEERTSEEEAYEILSEQVELELSDETESQDPDVEQ